MLITRKVVLGTDTPIFLTVLVHIKFGLISLSFEFSKNLRKTIDLTSENFREYLKTDLPYVLKPLLGLFILFGLLFIMIFTNISPNISVGIFIVFLALLLTIFCVLWFSYIILWLTESKAYHVLAKYENFKHTYADTLHYTIHFRRRIFYAMIINFGVVFGTILVTYIAIFVGIIISFVLFYNSSPGIIFFSLLLILLFILLLFLFVLLKLTPLQLYPTVMLIENKLGYKEGLNRAFDILPGWKNRVKFIACQGLLSYIVSFISQFIFMGLFFGSIIAGLLISALFKLTGPSSLFLIFLAVLISFFIYFIGLSEVQTMVLGNFHGQSYVSLVKPELIPPKEGSLYPPTNNYSGKVYCVNCGQPLNPEQIFCPNCGEPVKSK